MWSMISCNTSLLFQCTSFHDPCPHLEKLREGRRLDDSPLQDSSLSLIIKGHSRMFGCQEMCLSRHICHASLAGSQYAMPLNEPLFVLFLKSLL